jgi:polyisoprenyl-phosphate glycosyltransferase
VCIAIFPAVCFCDRLQAAPQACPMTTPDPTPAAPERDEPVPSSSASSAVLSVVVPMHNEADNIDALVEEVARAFADLPGIVGELLLVNDGSSDASVSVALAAAEMHKVSVTVVDLSRNFGKETAMSAGADLAEGDAVVFMDADLQHPPDLLGELVAKWRSGAEVVTAVRAQTARKSAFRHAASRIFQGAFRQGRDHETPEGTTDFRLLDRKVVLALRTIRERKRMFRGLIDWMGFRRAYVPFSARARHAGVPRYTTRKLLALAIDGLLSHSEAPLRLVLYSGLITCALAGLGLLWMVFAEQIFGVVFHYTPLAKAVVFNTGLVGVVLLALGVQGLYLAKIQHEVAARPLYLVREVLTSKVAKPSRSEQAQIAQG